MAGVRATQPDAVCCAIAPQMPSAAIEFGSRQRRTVARWWEAQLYTSVYPGKAEAAAARVRGARCVVMGGPKYGLRPYRVMPVKHGENHRKVRTRHARAAFAAHASLRVRKGFTR